MPRMSAMATSLTRGRIAQTLSTPQRVARGVRLVDDLVGALQERRRNREPERLGGLGVDGQLELRWLLDGKAAGAGALEDLVDVRGGPLIEVRIARPVAHQPADVDVLTGREDRRQPVLGRLLGEQRKIRLRD